LAILFVEKLVASSVEIVIWSPHFLFWESVMDVEQIAVNTIKTLGMDAIQAANSGHPGMVMGMADIATVLWHDFVQYDPKDAEWPNRDRVVLSNGHGSMLLYSMLHLTGTSLSLDDLRNFRQWGAPTAGHPEYGYAPGIETTTGPLGQGVANGVGMAMAERFLREKHGSELINHHTYVLCGDGCLMEGVASEAASLAGHLQLGKLIVLYDDNRITIDGQTDLSFSEDVGMRFASYGWDVQRIDGHDRAAIRDAVEKAKAAKKPSLICCRTVIGHGSPNKAGSNKTHGSPLGADEVAATKAAMGMNPHEQFAIDDRVYSFFQQRDADRAQMRESWTAKVHSNENGASLLRDLADIDLSQVEWPSFEAGSSMATRGANGSVIQAISKAVPNFVGGSADLAGSNKTTIKDGGHWSASSFVGRNIHFGIREHAMAGICNGLKLHGGVHPFCATFLVFHDYMRPSVRLAAIMHQPVIFVYTHDSIFVGEDGPTHQPIEQLEAMRIIPNLWVFRPADANETSIVWKQALMRRDGPSSLCFTRQGLPILPASSVQGAKNGGYVLSKGDGVGTELTLCASGSEVSLALASKKELEKIGYSVRVVSIPCRELFEQQEQAYQQDVLGSAPRFVLEAGVGRGWLGYVDSAEYLVSLERFGASAPGAVVAEKLGLSVSNVVHIVCSKV
jgi:transketolase